MKLYYRRLGKTPGTPLIILHGLYGSSDNWLNIGKALSEYQTVYILDQRNHGQSPHSNEHSYDRMRDDLQQFMEDHNISKANLMGHSMGGKTALFYALKYPEKINTLIVVDIGPGSYQSPEENSPRTINHLSILDALYNLDTSQVKTLRDADQQLADHIPYQRVRQFLLKNLKRNEQGHYQWILNVPVLRNELSNIMGGVNIEKTGSSSNSKHQQHPVLFIKGKKSAYIGAKQKEEIYKLYPEAEITEIENAGHWVHAEQRERFMDTVMSFLEKNQENVM